MSWFSPLRYPGHITEAVFHFNEAKHRIDRQPSQTEVARSLSDALNKIQTEFFLDEPNRPNGEVARFQTLIVRGLDPKGRDRLIDGDELK